LNQPKTFFNESFFYAKIMRFVEGYDRSDNKLLELEAEKNVKLKVEKQEEARREVVAEAKTMRRT